MTSNEAVQTAMNLLLKHGIETAVIIAKCPDSNFFDLNIKGSRTYLNGALDQSRDIIKAEFFGQNTRPPEGEGWKKGE